MKEILRDANELRSALGYLLMQCAIASGPMHDIAEKEWARIRPAMERFDAWRDSPAGQLELLGPEDADRIATIRAATGM